MSAACIAARPSPTTRACRPSPVSTRRLLHGRPGRPCWRRSLRSSTLELRWTHLRRTADRRPVPPRRRVAGTAQARPHETGCGAVPRGELPEPRLSRRPCDESIEEGGRLRWRTTMTLHDVGYSFRHNFPQPSAPPLDADAVDVPTSPAPSPRRRRCVLSVRAARRSARGTPRRRIANPSASTIAAGSRSSPRGREGTARRRAPRASHRTPR